MALDDQRFLMGRLVSRSGGDVEDELRFVLVQNWVEEVRRTLPLD